MWPALMFAASRNARVKGRTSILIVSINTRKGFNHVGAPLGSSLAVNVEGEKATAEIMRVLHSGNASVRVNKRWLEILNI